MVSLHEGLAAHQLALRAERKSPATLRQYRSVQASFDRWLSGQVGEPATVGHVTASVCRTYCAYLAEQRMITQETLRQYVTALKLHFDWLVGEGLASRNPWERVVKPKKRVARRKPAERSAVVAMMSEAVHTEQPLRNAAIVSLIADSGLRRAEVCRVTLDNLSLFPRHATDQPAGRIEVRGKGDKVRVVYFGDKTALALSRYRQEERPRSSSPHLFLTRSAQPLRGQGVYEILQRLADLAHIDSGLVSPHRIRSTFASEQAALGVPLSVLQEQLGHSRIEQTMHYVHTSEQVSQQAYRSPLDNWGEVRATRRTTKGR